MTACIIIIIIIIVVKFFVIVISTIVTSAIAETCVCSCGIGIDIPVANVGMRYPLFGAKLTFDVSVASLLQRLFI